MQVRFLPGLQKFNNLCQSFDQQRFFNVRISMILNKRKRDTQWDLQRSKTFKILAPQFNGQNRSFLNFRQQFDSARGHTCDFKLLLVNRLVIFFIESFLSLVCILMPSIRPKLLLQSLFSRSLEDSNLNSRQKLMERCAYAAVQLGASFRPLQLLGLEDLLAFL